MGSYADSILNPGEKIIYEGKLSLIVFFWWGVVILFCLFSCVISLGSWGRGGGTVAIATLLAGGLIAIYDYLVWASSEYVVTSQRIILKTGIIRRNSFEMRLEKIESIRFHQGIIGRWLNFGTITVTGTGDTSKPFAHIKDPIQFKRATEEAISKREAELRKG